VVTVSSLPLGTPSSFANPAAIGIPDQGAGTPYPSTINVSGLAGTISNVTVTLRGLSHSWGNDIDVLLVGPGGQKVTLMSDAGTSGINNANLTFSDAATRTLPQTGSLVSGTYRPTDYPPADTYPSPAPAGPYATTLSSFNGQSGNGTWSLYVFDDGPGDLGSFAAGWSLSITTVGSGARLSGAINGLPRVGIPAEITSIDLHDPETIRVTINGEIGMNYTLEASSDLVEWVRVDMQKNATGSVVLGETRTTNVVRFYRAASVP
jgi:subtilisin-like proprotein convertase family protein